MPHQRIEIQTSKTKIVLAILGSILLSIAGYFCFAVIADDQDRFTPIAVKAAGVLAMLFFGVIAVYATGRMFSNKPGLIIDADGFTDHSNAASSGFVPWADVLAIKPGEMYSTKFLLIYIRDPEAYIANATGLKKKLMQGNMGMYGTPVTLAAGTLNCSIGELEKLMVEKWADAIVP